MKERKGRPRIKVHLPTLGMMVRIILLSAVDVIENILEKNGVA